MLLRAATQLTMTDVFVISVAIKFGFLGMIVWIFRAIKREDRQARPEPAHLLASVAPLKRVAVVYCPFCEAEHTASVRMEQVGTDAVYELICWNCRAALPENALVSIVEPGEWLAQHPAGVTSNE